jgi:predicted P-loop ATPase
MGQFIVSLYNGATGKSKTSHFLDITELWTSITAPENEKLITWSTQLWDAKKDPAEYKRLKESQCPAFIVGKFPERKDSACETYVPLLGFDIDSMGFEAIVEDCIQQLKDCPFVRAAYPSPSRTGLRIFVECTSTLVTHKAYYEAISSHLSEFLNIPTDKDIRKELSSQGLIKAEIEAEIKRREHLDSSTSNPARLWFYTHVPTGLFYHNPHSHIFTIEPSPQRTLSVQRPIQKTTGKQFEPITDAFKIELCLDKVSRQNIPGGRNNFVFAAACEMARFGVGNDAATSALSQFEQSDFDQAEIIKTVDSAYKSKGREYSDPQIMKYAQMISQDELPGNTWSTSNSQAATAISEPEQATDEEDEEFQGESKNAEKSKFLRIKKYISDRYEFRRNLVSLDVEAKRRSKNATWQILNENDLFCELMEAGYTGVESPTIALIKSSFVKDYDPLLEYFQSLPKWTDQQPDYITQLANYVKAKDREWFNRQFKKMLIRSVACAIGRIPFNKHCFVLKSGQNDGKSSFIRFLCPPRLADYMTDFIDMESKDGRIALCQNYIINLDELSVFSRSDVKKAKALFTFEKIKERLPYDRKATTIKRRASFIASTNEDEFLVDETGNVRWLVFEIEGIQHDNGGAKGYNANIKIDLVYSQAYSLMMSGFEMHLSKEEIAKSERNNQSYQIATVEQELIQKYFAPGSKEDGESTFMNATSIMAVLQENIKTTLNKVPVGRALKILGFEQTQKHDRRTNYQVKGYYVRRLSNEPEERKIF